MMIRVFVPYSPDGQVDETVRIEVRRPQGVTEAGRVVRVSRDTGDPFMPELVAIRGETR